MAGYRLTHAPRADIISILAWSHEQLGEGARKRCEVFEEIVGRFVYLHPPGCYVFVDLPLALLPALSPKPRLIGRYRQRRLQLEHPVITLSHLYLHAGLIEVQGPAGFGRQGDHPPLLDRQVPVPCAHACDGRTSSGIAAIPYNG